MKTKILNIIGAMMLMLSFVACSEDHTSDLQLSGDCRVEAFALDGYEGTIDFTTRSIVVRLPEVYETSAMKVTSLSISNGAQCNISLGQTLNMDAAKVMHVSNGDVFLDWTISVLRDEARIYQFVVNDIYRGNIDQEAKTITIYVPASVDITNLVPTIEFSANATITPASGVSQDFSNPVTYTVTNNSAESTYTVTVIAIDKPKALFIGAASTMDDLDPEAKEACLWMMSNVEGTLYASFAELKAGTVDLDECKIMWWHYHKDGGVDGHDQFVANAPEALEAVNVLRSFYENGGSLFLTRYATNLPSFIGATGDDEWTTPNNCWGQDEDKAELCGGPWDFTNSTAQYHIGTDWGDYPDHAAWENRTKATILGVGGDGAVVAWEYPAKDGKGGIICIGSGCYDWYSYTFEAGYVENFHKNIATMTKNAINYLTK